jgi:hypothetical protein
MLPGRPILLCQDLWFNLLIAEFISKTRHLMPFDAADIVLKPRWWFEAA